MSSGKSKIALAMGVFWIGVAIATAIIAYGTHAGARHPNPSILLITMPIAAAGLLPALMGAKKTALTVLQVACFLFFTAVVIAMDSKAIGPNWPAYTTVATALILGVVSFGTVSRMSFNTEETEAGNSTDES